MRSMDVGLMEKFESYLHEKYADQAENEQEKEGEEAREAERDREDQCSLDGKELEL